MLLLVLLHLRLGTEEHWVAICHRIRVVGIIVAGGLATVLVEIRAMPQGLQL